MGKINKAILALGSNIGDRTENLEKAIHELNKIGQVKNESCSYFNDPVGFDSNHEFANKVVQFETSLSSEYLLEEIQRIETLLRREKTKKGYEDRTIDIDIIFFNKEISQNPSLQLPHPEYRKRDFVLIPMRQVGDFKDPSTFIYSSQLLR